MTKHLGYSIIGGIIFILTTVVVLWFADRGIHESFEDAVKTSAIFQSALRASFWIGVLAGSISSIALRKSQNRKVYVWIIMVFILTLMELVIITIV